VYVEVGGVLLGVCGRGGVFLFAETEPGHSFFAGSEVVGCLGTVGDGVPCYYCNKDRRKPFEEEQESPGCYGTVFSYSYNDPG